MFFPMIGKSMRYVHHRRTKEDARLDLIAAAISLLILIAAVVLSSFMNESVTEPRSDPAVEADAPSTP